MIFVGVDVESIEVFAQGIHPKVAMIDAINIDHGNYHKHEHFSEHMSSQILLIDQKINDSLHSVRSRSLSRMYSSCQKHNRFLISFGPGLFGKEELIENFLIVFFFIGLILRGDSYEMNWPFF